MNYVRLDSGDFAREDVVGYRLLDKAPWHGGKETGTLADSRRKLAVPVAPSKIICVGRNYRAHAKELGNEVPKEPLLFFKPPSALVLDHVRLPAQSERVEHEAELGVVIGPERTIFGLIAVCDVTARDLQKKDGQWTRAKGYDTFCPVGPAITTGLDWQRRDVICRVNGAERQHGNTSDMLFSVPMLIDFIASVMTLEPGDLLVTGTPEGVGPIVAGDAVEVDVTGLRPARFTVQTR